MLKGVVVHLYCIYGWYISEPRFRRRPSKELVDTQEWIQQLIRPINFSVCLTPALRAMLTVFFAYFQNQIRVFFAYF